MPSATRSNLRRRLLELVGHTLSTARPEQLHRPPRHVLLLRPDHIGDVLLTAPAVALLRQALPAARLTYLVGPWSVEAARHGPAVDELRTLAYPGFSRLPKGHLLAPYLLLAREARRLRQHDYDLAIVWRPDHWWGALLTLVAGIPLRVGGATPQTAPLLTHSLSLAADRHATERALDLARLVLQIAGSPASAAASTATESRLLFDVPTGAIAEADTLWRRLALPTKNVVAIQPNAGVPLKSWPLDRWAALAHTLTERGLHVLLVGAPADASTLVQLQARLGSTRTTVACGQSLAVSAALYARCEVVVGPDSGAAHLAAAVETPTVRLYGPAASTIYGPWPVGDPGQRVLQTDALHCVPCGALVDPPCGADRLPACLLALEVEQVLKAIESVIVQS